MKFSTLLLITLSLFSSLGKGAAPLVSNTTPTSSKTLDQVVIVGASLGSNPFLSHNLGEVFDVMVSQDTSCTLFKANPRFFKSPLAISKKQITSVPERATLVLAIDFLFWSGYGIRTSDQERLAVFEEGLSLLENVKCKMILGDLPDLSTSQEFVSRVNAKVLSQNQVPRRDILKKLNARIYEWAALRENVEIFPLAATLETIRKGEELRVGTHKWSSKKVQELLFFDNMHPSLEGLVVLTYKVGTMLVEFGWAKDDELLLDPKEILAQLKHKKTASAKRSNPNQKE